MFNIIIWSILGVLTMCVNNSDTYKINFILTWVVLMVHLIERYIVH